MAYTQYAGRIHADASPVQAMPVHNNDAGKWVAAPRWLFPAVVGAVVVGSAIVGLSFGIVAVVAFKVFCWSTGIH